MNYEPLAVKLRPTSIDDFIGQSHLIGSDGIITPLIENDTFLSSIFYGPPGTGKTTLATLIAKQLHMPTKMVNATTINKAELVQIFATAKLHPRFLLIIDEIHRINKDKQDLLLPEIESGNIILCGITTENPYHAINHAIRSRTQIFQFQALSEADILNGLIQATDKLQISALPATLQVIAANSNGDFRTALNQLELGIASSWKSIKTDKQHIFNEDEKYNLLSALQKSIRGSDIDAAMYWLAKLINIGDLIALNRRILVIAYEDIGLAHPALCGRVLSAIEATTIVGLPEAQIIYAEIIAELALSPKSKSAYEAIKSAQQALTHTDLPVPDWISMTPLNKEKAYDYNAKNEWIKENYLPKEMAQATFYTPWHNGSEKTLAENYSKLKKIKKSETR
ncbi:MAG: AAA family ATPase [Culicoidibacterales bacterium]